MKHRKVLWVVMMAAAVCLTLTACMRDGSLTLDSRSEGAATEAPAATAVPGANANNNAGALNGGAANEGNTAGTANGALGAFDWANGAADIERAIAQISELSEARVVVTNSTALVGVRFDGAYKGQLTERIREMVAAEVLKADPGIQTVAVTSDPEDVQKVYDLSERIRAGRTASELSGEINAIVRNATTMR